jgi:hypothetical protein
VRDVPHLRRERRAFAQLACECHDDEEKSVALVEREGEDAEVGRNAYQKPENRGGPERLNNVAFSNDGCSMYVVDYGEVFTDFQMTPQFYTVPKSGVIWTITYEGK